IYLSKVVLYEYFKMKDQLDDSLETQVAAHHGPSNCVFRSILLLTGSAQKIAANQKVLPQVAEQVQNQVISVQHVRTELSAIQTCFTRCYLEMARLVDQLLLGVDTKYKLEDLDDDLSNSMMGYRFRHHNEIINNQFEGKILWKILQNENL